MKKLFIIIIFVLAGLSIGSAFIPEAVKASQPTRFEQVTIQKIYGQDDTDTYLTRVEAWHDKESGAEIVCLIGETHGNPSCVTTGRNWK